MPTYRIRCHQKIEEGLSRLLMSSPALYLNCCIYSHCCSLHLLLAIKCTAFCVNYKFNLATIPPYFYLCSRTIRFYLQLLQLQLSNNSCFSVKYISNNHVPSCSRKLFQLGM